MSNSLIAAQPTFITPDDLCTIGNVIRTHGYKDKNNKEHTSLEKTYTTRLGTGPADPEHPITRKLEIEGYPLSHLRLFFTLEDLTRTTTEIFHRPYVEFAGDTYAIYSCTKEAGQLYRSIGVKQPNPRNP